MAGATREARAAGERLPDRISIGVLARTFTDELIDEVIDEAGAREKRYRLLPARLVVLLTLACWLFTRTGYVGVLGKLVDAHLVAGGARGWSMPGTEAIGRARERLGPAPLRLLFGKVVGPCGRAGTPGVFYRGLRVATVDGFTLDVKNTQENLEYFGRGGNGSGTKNPYPQLRALALAESGTRSLLGVAHGPCTVGEKTLALDLLPALGPGMLVLADRNFISFTLWTKAAATGADLCWRVPASFTLTPTAVLADGTYLSTLRAPRRKERDPVTVRIIEYSVTTSHDARTGEGGTDGAGEVSELFVLATTLLDPAHAPAEDLADLYHLRWQAETGIGDLKGQRGSPEHVLRSKKPATAIQELYAMFCVYQAVRDLIDYASPPGLDPSRVSFTKAIDAARDTVTRAALSPPAPNGAPSPTSPPP